MTTSTCSRTDAASKTVIDGDETCGGEPLGASQTHPTTGRLKGARRIEELGRLRETDRLGKGVAGAYSGRVGACGHLQ